MGFRKWFADKLDPSRTATPPVRPPAFPLGRKSATATASLTGARTIRNIIGKEKTSKELKLAYACEPCVHKAINKQASDTFERWFEVRPPEGEELPERVDEVVKDLVTRTGMKQKLILMLKQAMILGTGYLEIVFDNDSADLDEGPNGGGISDLVLVDSDTIVPIVDEKFGSETHGEILHFEQTISGEVKKIHPSRIIYFPFDQMGTEPEGISVIRPVYELVKSKIILDQLSGKIPQSVVKQIIDLRITGANTDDLKKGEEKLKEVQNALRFVGSEKHDFKVHDAGRGLDVEPFTEHVVQQLSTGLGIPKTIMTGAEAGKLATAEINLRDYYSDIRNLQERFTPIIRRVFDVEFEFQSLKDINYEIEWNVLYTNDAAESEILFNKARAADYLITSGTLSADEVREIFFGLEPRESNPENEAVGDDYA